jgi:hypothetical protein
MRTWHFSVWVITVMAGALYTIIQTGPDTAGENLCKLAKKAIPSISDQCVPSFGQWGPTTILIIGLIFGALVVWDLIGWIKKRRAKRPKRISRKSVHLMEAIWRVAERSAWGRWKDAQTLASGGTRSEIYKLHLSEHVVREAAEDGNLIVRARQKNSTEYTILPSDFWRVIYIDIQPDPISLWRVTVKPRHGAEVSVPEYDDLVVDRHQLELQWPERSWQYEWHILRLRLKALFRTMTEKKPKESAPQKEAPREISAEPLTVASPPPITEAVPVASPVPAVTPSPNAPEGWEKLFSIGDDGRSIWLRFLPDNKTYRADTLVLIVYGHKVLRGLTKVGMRAAHASVDKSIDVAPARPFDDNPWARLAYGGLRGLMPVDKDPSEGCVPSYLERVGLSQGGMYQLTEAGENHARNLAFDLISRAD